MNQEEEAERCLTFGQRYHLCGIEVRFCDFQPYDCVTLRRWGCCGYTIRTLFCIGETIFGYLLPGTYILTLERIGHKANFFVRLSPGTNVKLSYRISNQCWHWCRDSNVYFYNRNLKNKF